MNLKAVALLTISLVASCASAMPRNATKHAMQMREQQVKAATKKLSQAERRHLQREAQTLTNALRKGKSKKKHNLKRGITAPLF